MVAGKQTLWWNDMVQAKEKSEVNNSAFGAASFFMSNPLAALFAEVSGTVLQTIATAQKEWAEFMDRRVREDIAVLHQLMQCQSPADFNRAYSDYVTKAVQQYQEQSAKIALRGQSLAGHITRSAQNEEGSRAQSRH